MQSPEVEEHIATSMRLAEALGFNGTPSFVVGDQLDPRLCGKAAVGRSRGDSSTGGSSERPIAALSCARLPFPFVDVERVQTAIRRSILVVAVSMALSRNALAHSFTAALIVAAITVKQASQKPSAASCWRQTSGMGTRTKRLTGIWVGSMCMYFRFRAMQRGWSKA